MSEPFVLTTRDVAQLYGDKFFAFGSGDSGIEWKVKPESKVYFILDKKEFFNKGLTELLRKIVVSIGISEKEAGFGLISGMPPLDSFFEVPQPNAVVFGRQFLTDTIYEKQQDGKTIYFSASLSELSKNAAYKKELWDFLKGLMHTLGK